MLDHDAATAALISRVFGGQSEGLTKNYVLDNITLYWLAKTLDPNRPGLRLSVCPKLLSPGRFR
ncbi:MAG: hypothetical protein QM757_25965 [Paludibaculum sp.]